MVEDEWELFGGLALFVNDPGLHFAKSGASIGWRSGYEVCMDRDGVVNMCLLMLITDFS